MTRQPPGETSDFGVTYVFVCDGCDLEPSPEPGHSYAYSIHGCAVRISTTFAWCSSCRTVVHAEDLQATRSSLIDGLCEYPEEGEFYDGWEIEELWLKATHANILRDLMNRSSPPRCLSCGSPDVIQIEPAVLPQRCGQKVDTGVMHLGCSGRFQMCCVPQSKQRVRRYDLDGRYLES